MVRVVALRALVASTCAALMVACASTAPPVAATDRAEIEARSVALLTAYAANDEDGVVRLLDPASFTMFGSDVSEVAHGPDELRRLMADDFALWHSAAFGPVRDMDVRVQGSLATAFFHAPFSAAGGPPVMVRFSTVWHKIRGEWLLTQTANTVPTTGSSAHDLVLRR